MTTTIRTAAGTEVPVGTWDIDPAHSSIEFTVRHLGLSKVRGSFRQFSGTLTIADDPVLSAATATIDLASVDTGNDDRDTHLRSTDFFDTDRHPEMVFASTGVRPDGDGWVLEGDLTIGSTTKPIELDLEVHGVADDPYGNHKAGFSATGSLSRKAYGIDFDAPAGADRVLIGDKVTLELEIQAALRS